ncbi:MAG: InlB B-repeat-containing protein, partial [Clostridia bacterium]|nr:InlB B-repeat-containing protein [Clostridia bacterium]
PVTASLTLYGAWIKLIAITFTALGERVESVVIDENGTLSVLPSAPAKASETKQNGNILTFTFDAWFTEEGEKVTLNTVFAEDTVLVANYSHVEKRNGMVVTYDENGNAQYSIATTNRGTILDGMTCDWEAYSAYEFTHTLTYGKWDASKHANYRATIFTNAGSDIDFNGDKVDAGGMPEGTIWFNFQRGTVIFGAKIYGSSKNTWEATFGGLSADCPYKVHYNALVAGKPASFVWKFKYGVRDDNTAWIKLYVMDSLLFTYNLEADGVTHTTSDGKTLDMVDGEIVWGKVCNDNNQRTVTPYYSPYINATESAVMTRGNDVGLWPWGSCANVGGLLIHDISNVPTESRDPMAKVHNVVYKNTYGTDIESTACLNDMIGSFVADDSGILFADASDKNSAYYNKFIGWSLTEGGEIATAFANATVVNGLITVYPVYQKIELNTLSFDADNGSETVYSYYAPGEAVVMPEAPEKEGYIAENGSQVTFVFKGWYAGDVAFDADAELTEDVALKAVYEKTSAFRVDFVTEYVTVEYALVAENGTFEPEMPADREDVYFAGWYYDAAYVNAFDASAPVTENLTLYGLWESYLEIKFVAQDETVDILSVKKNGSISEFPVAPEKDMDIKPNANQVTYAFDAWYTEAEEKVTAKTQFAESTTLTAKYSATETRNGMVVSYDENGKAQYSIATTNRGTILDGMTCDWETYSAYEFTHTLTYGKWNASKHANYRATIFTNAGNDIDFNGDKDATLVDAEGAIWFNFQRGTVIFGAKIYGSSKNTWEVSFGGLSLDCPYKVHYNALVAGEPASFVWKYKYGVRNDNTAWIKLYIMDSLLFTYNLEADAAKHTTSDGKTLDMVDGEIVWGQVCNDNNQRTATPYYSPYINATEEAVIPRGNDVGLWPWGTCANVGGLLIHDISNTPIERRQTEDSSDGAQTVAVLEAVLPGDKRSVVTE